MTAEGQPREVHGCWHAYRPCREAVTCSWDWAML